MTVIGIDAHKRTQTLVTIDSGECKLGPKTVSASSSGHAEAMHWATTRFGIDLTWAVEDNRSVTGLLERELLGVDLGQELLDGDRRVRRADRAQHVESVLGKRQLGIHDGLPADFP
jgi:hypothetical protein